MNKNDGCFENENGKRSSVDYVRRLLLAPLHEGIMMNLFLAFFFSFDSLCVLCIFNMDELVVSFLI